MEEPRLQHGSPSPNCRNSLIHAYHAHFLSWAKTAGTPPVWEHWNDSWEGLLGGCICYAQSPDPPWDWIWCKSRVFFVSWLGALHLSRAAASKASMAEAGENPRSAVKGFVVARQWWEALENSKPTLFTDLGVTAPYRVRNSLLPIVFFYLEYMVSGVREKSCL